jgi:hypothetical protein
MMVARSPLLSVGRILLTSMYVMPKMTAQPPANMLTSSSVFHLLSTRPAICASTG